MQLVSEKRVPDESPPSLTNLISAATAATATTPPPNLQAEYVHRAAWKAAVLGTLNVLIVVTAVRLITLTAVIGGIVLTAIALNSPDPWRVGVLAIYAVAVVVPVIAMASRH
jgi:hypothetical protein